MTAGRRPWREYDAQLDVGRRRVGGGAVDPSGFLLRWGRPGVCVCGVRLRGCGHVAQLDVNERRVGGGVVNQGVVIGFLLR